MEDPGYLTELTQKQIPKTPTNINQCVFQSNDCVV